MKEIHVIGIGAGDPDQLTLQAVREMGRADVFFLLDKGEDKAGLVAARELLLARHARPGHRVVVARDPERDRTAPTSGYVAAVDDWRRRRAGIYQRLIAEELADDERGAFLVWGDPALYDSTAGILQEVQARGEVEFSWTVVPGISSVSTLAARHRTGLNQVGRPIQITTGRRLAESGLPDGVDDVVVMLDAHQAFARFTDQDLHIHWGAYLGTPDEILISGPLADVADRIRATRAEARARNGWIMDTYLLRRAGPADAEGPGGPGGPEGPGPGPATADPAGDGVGADPAGDGEAAGGP
ncbi:precorrin-6A synthase (deacetylating) [Streptomyces sp. HPF1205]|uniref:precorrin-6A synthase (deacetylating) n=1 Tax=Streptomyces sp. HPF1205 TaxID=2873262 RepID=UPI001CECB81F|nr:precorrin-6A synthase (deacetylating) [Streptomyces sp. HPF1205]